MPKPAQKDADALAAAAGTKGASPAAPPAAAPPEPKKPHERLCKWTDDSQFNLESWVAGKLRATLVAYDLPGIGKCELTFREPTGEEYREVDGMVAQAVGMRTLFTEGDVQRFRNAAMTGAALVAVNRKPWGAPAKEGDEPLSVATRTAELRKMSQSMLDLYIKAMADFNDALIDLVRSVDPKLFASPSGSSAPISPSPA